jgi:hypothetical protein
MEETDHHRKLIVLALRADDLTKTYKSYIEQHAHSFPF